ncbi:hypothetical protein F2Q69_00004946 [Brassica cretica]|uniref:Uncharacterized protein n=1 Tax=Brassica cretica TaxID=69181 RepID=A0A8S9NM95_BRACR|nr:hypothetical protein F2Q69_00004946 [Brassica cretica]
MMQPSPNLTASPDSVPIVLTNTSYNNGGIPFVLSDLKASPCSQTVETLASRCFKDRVKLLLALAKEYGVNREQISLLMNERSLGDDGELRSTNNEALSTVSYRIEWNMRHALKPTYETLFQMLNTHPGGLQFFFHRHRQWWRPLTETAVAEHHIVGSSAKEPHVSTTEREFKKEPKA